MYQSGIDFKRPYSIKALTPLIGQLPAAQGSLTSCLNFDFAILNLFEPSAP
jgi:hypothetical protein